MNERDHYLGGVPCRIDLDTDDPQDAAELYAQLLGWDIEPTAPTTPRVSRETAEPRVRRAARLDGAYIAGFGLPDADIGPQPPADASLTSATSGHGGTTRPARWCTSVAVTDLDGALRRVEDLGGSIAVEPRSIGEEGRWASFLDPAGAELGLWEARRLIGAERVNEPGTWNWSDLATDQPERAATFYAGVFGWQAQELSFEGETTWLWCLPGYGDDLERLDPGIRERHAEASAPPGFTDAVGWMARLDDVPAAEAPAWTVTFAVADVDETVRLAGELGVDVVMPPMSVDEVRFAVLRDPWGASFTVSQYLGRS